MICPKCNGELRIVPEQIGVDGNNLPIFHRIAYCDSCMIKKDLDIPVTEEPLIEPPIVDSEPDLQTKLAQQELDDLSKKMEDTNKSGAIVIILLFITVIAFAVGAIWGGIFFLIVFIVYASSFGKKIQRKEQLEHLAAGEKIVNVCPKCKSENIEMSMVQTGGYTTHGTSRVSNNINPLHPFTHTNVRKGTDYNFATYGNQCHCRNCGFVFTKPEVHYIK